MKRLNRKNTRLLREIWNANGDLSIYAKKVNAYGRRAGIKTFGYAYLVKRLDQLNICKSEFLHSKNRKEL